MPSICVQVLGRMRRLFYEADGARGRAVVFLHLGTGSTRSWERVRREVAAAGFRTVAYDRLGFGRSEPLAHWQDDFLDDGVLELWALLDALGVPGPVSLVGHSDGATIALLAAAGAPERVACVCAEAPHVFHSVKYSPHNMGGFDVFDEEVADTPRFRRAMERDHPGMAEQVLARWRTWWRSHVDWNVEECLPRVRAPLLSVHGARDIFFPEAHSQQIAAGVCRGELLTLDAGHEVHKERHEEFTRALLGFLAAHHPAARL